MENFKRCGRSSTLGRSRSMAVWSVLLSWLVAMIVPVIAQGQTRLSDKSSLKTESSLISGVYCSKDNLRLTISLTLNNAGERPIIIDKNYFAAIHSAVAKDVASLRKGVYELGLSSTFGYSFIRLDAVAPPEARFVILKPKESYQTKVNVYLPINDGLKSHSSGLTPGTHFMENLILTWGGPRNLGEQLRRQWEPFGLLWLDPIISDPVEFKVDAVPILGDCNN